MSGEIPVGSQGAPYRDGVGLWPSEPPAGCPIQPSELFAALAFTGRNAAYTKADTWYPSWADDGNLYSPFADGTANDVYVMWNNHLTGQAVITGDDPLALSVEVLGTTKVPPAPHGGVYPSANLVHNGVWYYGYYTLDDLVGMNWTVQGPFVGFRTSRDLGRTWSLPPHTPERPMFDEPRGLITLGAPHMVDFGRNMRHSPDQKAYLVSHGTCRRPEGPWRGQNWITGDQVFLSRVTPSEQTINDPASWEFFAGHDQQGRARWSNRLADIQPVIDWPNHCGCVTATYNPALKRYLMCVTDGRETIGQMNTFVLESAELTGPWRLVTYMKDFGTQAYFVNVPSKFIAPDGLGFWLCYSANFTGTPANPPGSRYAMCLHEARLVRR